MNSFYDINYKDNLHMDLHLPKSKSFDLFVYFHGGGLTSGTRKDAQFFAKTLAKSNIATASVEYSLYPDARFPQFIEDCAFAIRWIKDNICNWGKINRLFVGGSSAGAYISMMLCFDKSYLSAVNITPSEISAYIHDAGQPTSHFNVLNEQGIDGRRVIIDKTAPLYFVGTQKNYPPMLFIVSDDDMFGRYEQTMLTVKTLQHFGHDKSVYLKVMHGKHCEHTCKTDKKGEGVLGNIIKEFIDKI